jgi:nicotinate-nucleotide adenylyltransferase
MFDPPHAGHVAIAKRAIESLSGICHCYVVVTDQPPHRKAPRTSSANRLAMARAAFSELPNTEVSDIEIARFAATGEPTYMIDTVSELRKHRPGERPVLVLGADRAASFDSWHRWRELLDLADLCVMTREGAAESREAIARLRKLAPAATIHEISMVPIDISSTEVRDLVTAGRFDDAAKLVPDGVAPLLSTAYGAQIPN